MLLTLFDWGETPKAIKVQLLAISPKELGWLDRNRSYGRGQLVRLSESKLGCFLPRFTSCLPSNWSARAPEKDFPCIQIGAHVYPRLSVLHSGSRAARNEGVRYAGHVW